jgi:hypothetical protein
MWVPIGAWCGAALLTAVVLGFGAYEVAWKANRLRADLRRLQARADELAALQLRLAEAQERLGAAGLR